MEDVRDITVDVNDFIKMQLKNFNIELTDEQEDDINNNIWKILEGVSNGNYKHHM